MNASIKTTLILLKLGEIRPLCTSVSLCSVVNLECVEYRRHSSAFFSGDGLELVGGDVSEAGVHSFLVIEIHVPSQARFSFQE